MRLICRVPFCVEGHGWSQEELGERADLHPTYVGGIERGERNVSLENLGRLAGAFDLSLAELIDFSIEKRKSADTLRALIVGSLRGRSERDLMMLKHVLEAIDNWTQTARSK